MTRRLPALGLLGLVATASCAPGNTFDESPFQRSVEAVHAEVQNDHRNDVRVFAVRYGDYERLGTVTSHTRQSFRLPADWVDAGVSIALRVEPIGAQGHYTTRDFVLSPGSVIELTVRNFLSQSSFRIR